MGGPIDYYDQNALSTAFYDVLTPFDPAIQGDVDFYAGLIPEGSWVLEVGCGTGRVTFALAERDRAVVGLDIAPAMLAKAEARRRRLDPAIQQRTAFVRGDMTGFALNHRFDAVIAPYFGFSHLPRGAPRRRAFEAISRHLQPGGLAVIHAILPDRLAEPIAGDPDHPLIEVAFDDAGRRIRLYALEHSYDPNAGRYAQRLAYVVVEPDGSESRRTEERLVFHVSNLESEARGSGLFLERRAPFNEMGEMWLFRRR